MRRVFLILVHETDHWHIFEYGWHIFEFDASEACVAIQNWVWGKTDLERKNSQFAICLLFSDTIYK